MWQQVDVTLNLNGTAPKTAGTDNELADLDKTVSPEIARGLHRGCIEVA